MLTPQQEATLTNGGDNFDHWHSSDRQVTQQTLRQLQQLTNIVTAPAIYTVTTLEDIILCPVATVLQLPTSKQGMQFSVVRTGSGAVVCHRAGTDTIFGATNVTLTTLGEAFNFVAIPGGWILL